MHYLPSQEAIDFLAEKVAQMQQASRTVDRDLEKSIQKRTTIKMFHLSFICVNNLL